MQVEITSELATAHNKIVLAQDQVDRLTRQGKGRRDPDMKYWTEELTGWTNYANELNKRLYHGQIELSKQLRADGGIHVKTTHRGRFVDFFPQTALPPEIFDSLIIEDDYSDNNPACAHRGGRGTQLHHWAPKELFEDAEAWPKSYLCRVHHQEWHDKVTNKFRTLRRREERANVKPAA